MAKKQLENWLWTLDISEICHIHGDNGIVNTEFFVEDCKKTDLKFLMAIRIISILQYLPFPS